jgi:ribosome maturation factor RimP
MRDPITAKLESLLAPAVEALGYLWWGCVLKNGLLRVYIDKLGGVNVDDCVSATHQLRGVLMVHDPVRGDYTLEVSSPGLGRQLFTLAQYEQFKGHKVKLRLRIPQEGQRNFHGVIENIETAKSEITIQTQTQNKIFQFDDIEHANLVPDFGD